MTVPPLVSTSWLEAHLGDPTVAVVDGSWYLSAQERDALAEYETRHIPGAVFFDLDAVSDASSPLPHMLPSPEAFSTAMGRLGLSETQHILVYDGVGLFSAARVWWTFGVFGVSQVSVLDGGLPKWLEEGRPVEAGRPNTAPSVFNATFDATGIVDGEQVAEALESRAAQVVDARPAGRFSGAAAEPRDGVRSGHMPGARNLPMSDLLDGTRLKPADDLLATIRASGVDPERPIITSCGSGVTAAVLALALAQTGSPASRLYDGSWADWGSDERRPVVSGPADDD